MNINELSNNMTNNYNCEFINTFTYNGDTYIKAIEVGKGFITYRFFKLNVDVIEEVLDQELLSYLRETQTFNSNEEY